MKDIESRLIVNHKGKRYNIEFFNVRERTYCRIHRDSSFVSEGMALFHPEDDMKTWSVGFGRKTALTGAVRKLKFPLREKIWKAYMSA